MSKSHEPLIYDGQEMFSPENVSEAEWVRERCRETGAGIPDLLAESMFAGATVETPEMEAAATYLHNAIRRDQGLSHDPELIKNYEHVIAEQQRRELPSKLRFFARRRFLREIQNPTILTLSI